MKLANTVLEDEARPQGQGKFSIILFVGYKMTRDLKWMLSSNILLISKKIANFVR